ncbi:hypothetical protein L1987_22576 [Smallanthus sonchifolius]|uniref:Uncharacterized protein n=1 Tax=Smallanthus sonchifolius TaxID=185202 RepID=A0ACB9IEI1_9ASTR|nr:hypothetical protein L1987_22576 [Smallanthus sonchifolius]
MKKCQNEVTHITNAQNIIISIHHTKQNTISQVGSSEVSGCFIFLVFQFTRGEKKCWKENYLNRCARKWKYCDNSLSQELKFKAYVNTEGSQACELTNKEFLILGDMNKCQNGVTPLTHRPHHHTYTIAYHLASVSGCLSIYTTQPHINSTFISIKF